MSCCYDERCDGPAGDTTVLLYAVSNSQKSPDTPINNPCCCLVCRGLLSVGYCMLVDMLRRIRGDFSLLHCQLCTEVLSWGVSAETKGPIARFEALFEQSHC